MKIFEFLKKWYHLFFLLSLILFHGINNWLWINNNNSYYHLDDYYHLIISTKIYHIIFSDGQDYNFIGLSAFYQRPLMPFITATFFYPIFGVSANVGIMTNVLFLAVLIFITFAIGRKIYNKGTGMVAAFLVSMYPIVFGISRYYTYYIGLAAIFGISIYFLLLSNKFRNQKYSLLFGLSSGIGVLMSIFFVVLAIGPVLYVIFSSIKNSKKKERIKIYPNIFISFLICFLIAGIWNLYCMFEYDYLNRFSKTIFFQEQSIYHYLQLVKVSFIYYLEVLINYQLFLPFFILFCIGLFFFLKSKDKNIILLYWMLIPYLILSIKFLKQPKYTIPLLPVIAIISSFWIFKIKNKKFKKYIILLILFIGFVQFFIVSYSTFLNNIELFGFKIEGYTNPPLKSDWNERAILMYMIDNSENNPVKTILLIPFTYYIHESGAIDKFSSTLFNPLVFSYYSTLHELPAEIYLIYNSLEVYDLVPHIDFLMIKSDYLNIKWVNDTISDLDNFHLDKKFLLPYDDEIMIFKKY